MDYNNNPQSESASVTTSVTQPRFEPPRVSMARTAALPPRGSQPRITSLVPSSAEATRVSVVSRASAPQRASMPTRVSAPPANSDRIETHTALRVSNLPQPSEAAAAAPEAPKTPEALRTSLTARASIPIKPADPKPFTPPSEGAKRKILRELRELADNLVCRRKGLLLMDETPAVLAKRLQEIGVQNADCIRRQYRQVILTTDRKIGENISGVLLHHETLFQETANKFPFTKLLKLNNLVYGIKIDRGCVPFKRSKSENGEIEEDSDEGNAVIEYKTEGIDNLVPRCVAYHRHGCRFAKWRCVFHITENTPTLELINENANDMARFAAICQSTGLLPIISPEILPLGNHNIECAQRVTEKVLTIVYNALRDHDVMLDATILMPHMITPGLDCPEQLKEDAIAMATTQVMRRTVPAAVPGIMFLSGAQSEEQATITLNAINNVPLKVPWITTFAYGRVLQAQMMYIWNGKRENMKRAQEALLKRAKALGEAARGVYEVSPNKQE